MFAKLLIANRGAIAVRILRTAKRLGVRTVAVYSAADRYAPHVSDADEAYLLGPAPAAQSYLRQDLLLEVAQRSGAQAIHPGYGFLSENAAFAAACEAAGIAFIGPTPQQMRDFGLKHTARELAAANGVPLLPGSGLLADLGAAEQAAERIGYPVMLKSTAGGGGIGMQLCANSAELAAAYTSVERLARQNFSQGGVFLEKYVSSARHVEVQIFGDGQGQIVTLGERDCSLQRRNQKVIEETPAPGLSAAVRASLHESAARLARAVNYRSAGTVEFIYDAATEKFYFLEVNTRLQVEHGVTEQVTGVDLVEWMIRVAANEPPDLGAYRHAPRGHSIQARIYAEDPGKNFQPSSGPLTEVQLPAGVRVDAWIETGSEVSAHYDPLLAKVISHGATRDAAIAGLTAALTATRLQGIETNLQYLQQVLQQPVFLAGLHSTGTLAALKYQRATIDVLQPGTQSTVQDYPGRVGYWDVGVPPSGPMDDLAFRLANRIAGNSEGAAALELTITGPKLRFNVDTVIALAGASMTATLDGQTVALGVPIAVTAGSTLTLRSIVGAGQRTYLAIRGGIDVPSYLNSQATFTLGQFGGHAGRALRAGDVLRLSPLDPAAELPLAMPSEALPKYTGEWVLNATYGPHGAPDFFTAEDIAEFFATAWRVHYNSSRTGVRLIGPKPRWARADGGEAGLHPSNIHDNAYAIGAVDFTGDMPVILGPDGPSLGGFVCPAVVVRADRWKLGQLRPGDTVRFQCISIDAAIALDQAIGTALSQCVTPHYPPLQPLVAGKDTQAVLHVVAATANRVAVCYRQAGDRYLLIEYGPAVLDLELRFRVQALMDQLRATAVPGILELTPGIRSLQVHYDSSVLSQAQLLAILIDAEERLPALDDLVVASRVVHLPLSWDDPATRLAIEKYMQSVRSDAPWCPSNLEFIRRINGLETIDEVQQIVFAASYLVLGLGDVYLGAPVATPLDPRHRLVTTKYNPARTWTPENAVGIGGAYLCVYGMEGPGGYQFVGRTVQMWNRQARHPDFATDRPWLLRFFDQIRFYPVSAEELLQLRADFAKGVARVRIEPGVLRLREYREYLVTHGESIAAFKLRQQSAFEAERERWRAAGAESVTADLADSQADVTATASIPEDCIAITSPVTGSVWQVRVQVNETVRIDQELMVMEAMKMEIPVLAEAGGTVVQIRGTTGKAVQAGDVLLIVRLEGPSP